MRKKQVVRDLIGFKCPIPVLKIAKNIKKKLMLVTHW